MPPARRLPPAPAKAASARAVRARVLALTAALAGLAGCAEKGAPPEPEHGLRATRGVVLISLDTLRADHLGLYGYELDTSPFLDELAARAVVFERAFVQYPSTLTSHMSMLTGLYPAEHGVYPPADILSPDVPLLSEILQDAGFTTAGFTEGGFVHGRFGFRRGFDVFESRARRSADQVERTFERGLQFLRGLDDDEPFFLFLHTYAVHTPYAAPRAYRERFWQGDPPAGAFPPTGPAFSLFNARDGELSDELRDYFMALYDAEIRRLDDVLRHFVTELEAAGLAAETTLVITSDHGEEFQEHGKMNHSQLYTETLHVPLLVVHPDAAPGRVAEPVESVDLAPTLLDIARVRPPEPLSGRSLAGLLAGRGLEAGRPRPAPEAFAELAGGARSLYRDTGDGFWHLLTFEPNPRAWATRRLKLTVDGGPLDFEIRSFGEPRQVEVRGDDGEVLQVLDVDTEWSRVRLDVPDPPRRRVIELESPDCTPVEDSGKDGRPWRCHGFQVRGVALARAELYDLEADPGETRDLALEAVEHTRALYARLLELDHHDRRPSRSEELDDELREHLEALGYLQ